MTKNCFVLALAATLVLAVSLSPLGALEKQKLGTAIKMGPWYYLSILAAEEKGFWKASDLDMEWVPIGTTKGLHAAIAAGSVNVGIDTAAALIPAMSRGVPAIIVGNQQNFIATGLWVRTDSPVKEPKDLPKGARIGIVSLGGTDHAYGLMLFRALKQEKDVRFVALGGIPQSMAGLKAGAVDATVMIRPLMIPLFARGEVRLVAKQEDHIKAQLLGHIHWARRDFLKKSPQTVARTIKALLQANAFVKNNRAWSLEKVKEVQGLPIKAAELVYDMMDFSLDGKIPSGAVENIRNFLLEYQLVPKDKMPPIEEIYTTQLTG